MPRTKPRRIEGLPAGNKSWGLRLTTASPRQRKARGALSLTDSPFRTLLFRGDDATEGMDVLLHNNGQDSTLPWANPAGLCPAS